MRRTKNFQYYVKRLICTGLLANSLDKRFVRMYYLQPKILIEKTSRSVGKPEKAIKTKLSRDGAVW